MTDLRSTLLGAALVTFSALPPATASATEVAAPSEYALTLATCHGRYSALLEASWLSGHMTEAVRLRRDLLAAMSNALVAAETMPRPLWLALLNHRVSVKSQTKTLLSTAEFSADPRRKRLATAQVHRLITACDGFLIGLTRRL